MAKNILVRYESASRYKSQIGFWLTDEEGYNTLLNLVNEYRNDIDWNKHPFVYDGIEYSPDALFYGISTIKLDQEVAEFIFPYSSVIGNNVLTMFISWFTFEKGVLLNERVKKNNK